MYFKHLVNLIIQLKRPTFSLYIHSYWGKCSKCPLHVSKLENEVLLSSDNQICFDGCDWVKVCLKEQLWLVDSQCGSVGILLKFSHVNWCEKFQAWIWCEIFHTWNRCEFFIRHVQPCSTCEILNLHTFQTYFWCESGMKQAWTYENILYGFMYKHIW